jgi:hypothetical protein
MPCIGAKRITRAASSVKGRERIETVRKSKVLTACLITLVFLWTANAILFAWRIEIGRNQGFSMSPTFGDEAIYMTRVRPPEVHVGDIIEARIAVDGGISRVVKRVKRLDGGNVFLEGDNRIDTWRGWVPVHLGGG